MLLIFILTNGPESVTSEVAILSVELHFHQSHDIVAIRPILIK